jgi:hypothetical protein
MIFFFTPFTPSLWLGYQCHPIRSLPLLALLAILTSATVSSPSRSSRCLPLLALLAIFSLSSAALGSPSRLSFAVFKSATLGSPSRYLPLCGSSGHTPFMLLLALLALSAALGSPSLFLFDFLIFLRSSSPARMDPST